MSSSLAVYFHLPFCLRRCAYCDFFSTAGKMDLIPEYVDSLVREMRSISYKQNLAKRSSGEGKLGDISSVYFGGGTPSLLSPAQIRRILAALGIAFAVEPQAEISLEANPGTIHENTLAGYQAAGINRLSLGVQSANEDELRMLGRIHTVADAERAVADARRAGFTNINLDLIYGLPNQTLALWKNSLDRILEWTPEHISLYSLTLERGTKLAREVRRGALPAPDEDLAAEMYELAEEMLATAGYRHYEISNWARDDLKKTEGGQGGTICPPRSIFPAYACRHNLQYWRNLPYLGLGAGAHGCAAGRRYSNIRSVETYIERMRTDRKLRFPLSPATTMSRIRPPEEEARETMWLGLRLVEAGVDRAEYRKRFSEDYYWRFQKEIDESISEGLLEWTGRQERLRLTRRGRLLGNRVFSRFV